MAPTRLSPDQLNLRSSRTAILVIHGIGEQNPYETLDSFARGVFTELTRTCRLNAKLCPVEFAHKDWTQVGMRIGIFPKGADLPQCPVKGHPVHAQDQPSAYVDVFEYYWAPYTEDKLSAVETVKWVLFTDFTPLRYFADNLQEMIGAERLSRTQAFTRATKVYAREVLRIVFLYSSLAVSMFWLLAWLSRPHAWGAAFRTLAALVGPYDTWTRAVILLLYALFLLMVWFGLQALAELRRHPGAPIEGVGERVWLIFDLVLAVLFLGGGLAIDISSQSFAVWHLLQVISRNWQPLAGATLASVVSYALTAYVADIAVYTNMDEKSTNYTARNGILSGSSAMLKMLLLGDSYERVILAGHSLGSVIAYDTINELLSEYNAQPCLGKDRPDTTLDLPQLQKLKGLITFGSPLDKVYYFFREQVKRDQAIRAQILSMLHSFRKKSSGRDYEQFKFNYSFDQLDEPEPLLWLNAWASMDFVSAKLKFYLPNDQRRFPYRVPAVAHLKYWSDPNFYKYFCQRLVCFIGTVEFTTEVSDVPISGHICEISRKGCYVDTVVRLSEGTLLNLCITRDNHSFSTKGKITFARKGLDMGIVFVDPSKDELKVLDLWLAELASSTRQTKRRHGKTKSEFPQS